MDAIWTKLEKLIGRPVRKREEITRLVFYAKQARASPHFQGVAWWGKIVYNHIHV